MTIKIAELFAGIGGFRMGFQGANIKLGNDNLFKVVWSNQWEPGEKAQHASRVYEHHFGKVGHSNVDISSVEPDDVEELNGLNILVGGFPCQDYSVAKPLNKATGLQGKKGVLWWDIHRFIQSKRPEMAILENVDRLLASPGTQRGRDFAIMLSTLNDLKYAVEWRIINAAEYGFPQRRRRIFIIAHREGTRGYKRIHTSPVTALQSNGLIAKAFPIQSDNTYDVFPLSGEVWEITEKFNSGTGKKSPFQNSGVCINREFTTSKTVPYFEGEMSTLGSVLVLEDFEIPEEFFISDEELERWQYQKGAKKILRTKKNGIQYEYAEGGMSFPDSLEKPSRTIITSEGGRTPSRFKHVVQTPSGQFRRLLPVELEKLSGFPENHTDLPGITDSRRAFFIGNALVTGIIEKFAITIADEEFLNLGP